VSETDTSAFNERDAIFSMDDFADEIGEGHDSDSSSGEESDDEDKRKVVSCCWCSSFALVCCAGWRDARLLASIL
jgi:hypothetical protein